MVVKARNRPGRREKSASGGPRDTMTDPAWQSIRKSVRPESTSAPRRSRPNCLPDRAGRPSGRRPARGGRARSSGQGRGNGGLPARNLGGVGGTKADRAGAYRAVARDRAAGALRGGKRRVEDQQHGGATPQKDVAAGRFGDKGQAEDGAVECLGGVDVIGVASGFKDGIGPHRARFRKGAVRSTARPSRAGAHDTPTARFPSRRGAGQTPSKA